MKKLLAILWWCHIWKFHEWTSAVQQPGGSFAKMLMDGIADGSLNKHNIADHFNYCARMWCKRCGHFSELNDNKSTDPVYGCEPWIGRTMRFMKNVPPTPRVKSADTPKHTPRARTLAELEAMGALGPEITYRCEDPARNCPHVGYRRCDDCRPNTTNKN